MEFSKMFGLGRTFESHAMLARCERECPGTELLKCQIGVIPVLVDFALLLLSTSRALAQ